MTNRTQLMRFAVLAACAAGFGVPPVAHGQQQTLNVDAARDAVIATGIPFGPTTAQVMRPDALTGAPVVIGQYVATASILPFTINMTTPTAFDPDGDCWGAGALTLPTGIGLTPDIRSGDTVALSSGKRLVVPAGSDTAAGGPGVGCGDITTYAFNAVKTLAGGSGTDLAVSGVAQPLATGVAVRATDGGRATVPVAATLAEDGTWTATIPAAALARLADGAIIVEGIYSIPDVSTTAPAHIKGVPGTFTQRTPRSDPPKVAAPTPVPDAPVAAVPDLPAPQPPAIGRVTSVRVPTQIRLASARKGGLKVSFIVPAGVQVARVQLTRGGRTVLAKVVASATPGSRQTVKLTGSQLKRVLRRGRYTLSVAAGPSRTSLGATVERTVRVR